MYALVKPKKIKRMGRKMSILFARNASMTKKAPMEQLLKEADEFEKLILRRNANM